MLSNPVKFKSVHGANIVEVSYGSSDIECQQIVHTYNPMLRYRYGFLYTDITVQELGRRNHGYGRRRLYLKLQTPEHGLFEITLDDTTIKQVDDKIIWFRHNGISFLHIIKPPQKAHSDDTF